MTKTNVVGNELNRLRGDMLYLSNLRHNPRDIENELPRETDSDWWGGKRGTLFVRLENLRRAAEGLSSELVGRVENPAALEHRIRILVSRLRDDWTQMLCPGDWTEDESTRLNALYDEIEAVATIMRELPADTTARHRPQVDDKRNTEQLVRDYINSQREAGRPIEELTRDSIANAVQVSGGGVSNTKAWKALAAEKRQAKLPGTPDEAVFKAAHKRDWIAVQRLQEQEQRRMTGKSQDNSD